MTKLGRIAIVYPFGNIDSVPSLVNLIHLLSNQGYCIDVFTVMEDRFLPPHFREQNVSLLPIDIPARDKLPLLWRLLPGRITYRYFHSYQIRYRHQQIPYFCVFGVDAPGLILANQLFSILGVPIAYYSLELLLSYELSTDQQRDRKNAEIQYSQQSIFVVVQDEERSSILLNENHLDPNKIITLPNAPLGNPNPEKSNYLREKYRIADSQRVILHTGTLAAWGCIHQLVHSTREWPDDWVLVIHSRAIEGHSDYLCALEYLSSPGRVIFSTDPLPYEKYPDLVRSADIGVAFYCPTPGSVNTQDNIYYIGLSSGKFSYYLWAGLPVLMSDLPTFNRLNEQYLIGSIVKDPTSTKSSIECILSDYNNFSAHSLECFSRELNFFQSAKPLIRKIEAIAQK